MPRLLWILALPILLFACGSSCGSHELEQRLQGEWVYELSDSQQAREAAMEKILSDDPPTETELSEMSLDASDMVAALETLRLKTKNPGSHLLVEIKKDFIASQGERKGMRLLVEGPRMVLSVGSQRMGSTFSVQSQDGEKYLVETTSSSGAVETQTLIWVSDTHFRLTDPVGDTMDFVRP